MIEIGQTLPKSFSQLNVKNSSFFLSYFFKKDDWPKVYAGPMLPTLPYISHFVSITVYEYCKFWSLQFCCIKLMLLLSHSPILVHGWGEGNRRWLEVWPCMETLGVTLFLNKFLKIKYRYYKSKIFSRMKLLLRTEMGIDDWLVKMAVDAGFSGSFGCSMCIVS